MTAAIDAYKLAYHRAATHTFFNGFQPVRGAASFVYDAVGSGAIGATAGEIEVSMYSAKEIYYQARVVNSGSLVLSIEGRAAHIATQTQLKTVTITAAAATYFSVATVPYNVDRMRLGVRAASPAASDIFSAYIMLKPTRQ